MEFIGKLYSTLFRHSFKRTVYSILGLTLALALPVTLFLIQNQQDLRQRASGTNPVLIAFDLAAAVKPANQETPVKIVMNTGTKNIKRVKLDIKYDPAQVEYIRFAQSSRFNRLLNNPRPIEIGGKSPTITFELENTTQTPNTGIVDIGELIIKGKNNNTTTKIEILNAQVYESSGKDGSSAQVNSAATYTFINSTTSTLPTCTGIKTTNNTPLTTLQSGREYTFEGNNCQNASTYKWIFNRGNCPSTFSPTAPTTATFTTTMPAFPLTVNSCNFTVGLQICNASNQCSEYYTANSTVRYALSENAKQWQFNTLLSCANGATPIDTVTQASWSFKDSNNQSCPQRPEHPTGGGSTSTSASYNLTYTPTTCTNGTFGIFKAQTNDSATFKSANNQNITRSDTGDAVWNLNTLPNGTYTLNFDLPPSSCPALPLPSPCGEYGDVNNDEKVTEADALQILRYMSGFDNPTPEQINNSDVNNDGDITIEDAQLVREYIADPDNTFPVCDDTEAPTNTPVPGVCDAASNKPNNCACTAATASTCASGYCSAEGTCQEEEVDEQEPPVVCDPDPTLMNGERVINGADLLVARNEVLGIVNTNRASCMTSPATDLTTSTDVLKIRNEILGIPNE